MRRRIYRHQILCHCICQRPLSGLTQYASRLPQSRFRSVLSWPLATACSYFLTPLGVPDVVQAKLASEVIAGFIEGTVKYRQQIKRARYALYEVYEQIVSSDTIRALAARLDVLFFWSSYSLGRKALERFMHNPEKAAKDLNVDAELIKNANQCICRDFAAPNDLSDLTYTILKYYPEDNLTCLTNFVGSNDAQFVQWLKTTPNAANSTK